MVSVLITSYNRPSAVKTCIEYILALNLKIPFEIVVSDDGSSDNNIYTLKTFTSIDTLVTAEKNQGLGADINKGIKACKGNHILYCQEDFLLKKELSNVLGDAINCIKKNSLDMVRFQANYHFPKLHLIEKNIYRIPKFSFRNFYVNTFQYSDNPFVTKRSFFDTYRYFIEGTSGDYGEAEFAIRIASSNARIGITQPYYVVHDGSDSSTMTRTKKSSLTANRKNLHRFARAVRQHFEWLFYSKSRRRLITYNSSFK